MLRLFRRTRRNVRWVSCVGLLLLMPRPVEAQSVGVQGGFSLSSFKTDESVSGPLKQIVAPTGGMFVVIAPDSFTGRVDVLYSVRGAKLDTGAKFQLTYLEFPLGAQVHFARRSNSDLHVFGGTSIAIKLDAKITEGSVDVPIDDEIDDFDFGIFVGGGATFGRFVVDGRYTHGMRNINVVAPEVKNRAFAITFGIRLN